MSNKGAIDPVKPAGEMTTANSVTNGPSGQTAGARRLRDALEDDDVRQILKSRTADAADRPAR